MNILGQGNGEIFIYWAGSIWRGKVAQRLIA